MLVQSPHGKKLKRKVQGSSSGQIGSAQVINHAQGIYMQCTELAETGPAGD